MRPARSSSSLFRAWTSKPCWRRPVCLSNRRPVLPRGIPSRNCFSRSSPFFRLSSDSASPDVPVQEHEAQARDGDYHGASGPTESSVFLASVGTKFVSGAFARAPRIELSSVFSLSCSPSPPQRQPRMWLEYRHWSHSGERLLTPSAWPRRRTIPLCTDDASPFTSSLRVELPAVSCPNCSIV